MAARKKSIAPSPGLTSEPPLTPENYLFLENRPARKEAPRQLVLAQGSRVLPIYVREKKFTLQDRSSADRDSGTWQISLPPGSALVQPGRSAKRLSVREVMQSVKDKAGRKGMSEPFCPDWIDYTPHPKLASARGSLMRRINGQLIEPHYGVFGPDDRQVYYPSGYPWTCVGKILVWDNFSNPYPAWSGSGVLIGGRVVLTAGHMAPWGSKNWAMQFIPAFYNGSSTLGVGVSSWVSDYYGYNTNDSVSAWDMIVLRLYTPLGNSYGYFGTKAYDSSWEGGNYWSLAGYPGAVAGGNRPSRQMWWPVLDDDGDGNAQEVEYEADATPGDSGGPVFGFWGGMPYAIATHSGGSKTTFLGWTIEDTNVGAGGGALNNLVAWARSTWA